LSRNTKDLTSEITGLHLNTAQIAMMDYVWNRAAASVKAADGGTVLPNLSAALCESLFQLLVMFWTDLSSDGRMHRNAIVHFSGVLGIHPTELCFKKPYDYTPYLSALIWVGRLVILEYALPLTAYEQLKVPWPDRTTYLDQAQRLREDIRPKYLQRGSLAPIGYLIERLQHGRAIARREGPRTNISWSSDGLTLHIADASIHMRQFRHIIHGVIVGTQHLSRDLLFGWWPDIRLDRIHDDLTAHRPGSSFLSQPANDLQSCFRAVSKLAFSKEGGCSFKKKAGKAKLQRYLRDSDRLVRLLYAAIHMTSGMPARGEELRMIRWADTVTVQRNIFVYKGQIILIFAYNKANTNTNNSFFIVRSPCFIVQKLLFVYLAYIRPFRNFVSRQLGVLSDTPANPHLFTTHDNVSGCFSASVCHSCLKRAAPASPIRLSTSTYRQIAVSIAKKHLSAMIAPFDPNTPKDYDGFLQLLSFQTGHRPATHAAAYALEHGYPTKLQPDLINRYLENSQIWHEFTMTQPNDVLDYSSSLGVQSENGSQAIGYSLDKRLPQVAERTESEQSEVDVLSRASSPQDSQEDLSDATASSEMDVRPKASKRKRASSSCSPTTKRITDMRRELDRLLKERAASRPKRKESYS
jgi:hypothetical protein